MTEAAFSHSAKSLGRRLKDVWLLAEYQSRRQIMNLFKISLNSILFADLILIVLIHYILIKPYENLNDQLNDFFNPHGPIPN